MFSWREAILVDRHVIVLFLLILTTIVEGEEELETLTYTTIDVTQWARFGHTQFHEQTLIPEVRYQLFCCHMLTTYWQGVRRSIHAHILE